MTTRNYLLTWELGRNLGHLSRLLPLALDLQSRGHNVALAARDIPSAAQVFAGLKIEIVQAPCSPKIFPLQRQLSSYPDILATQGWHDPSILGSMVQRWVHLFNAYSADHIITDYSPTAVLAARSEALPTSAVGNGFEMPPAKCPLPPFPLLPTDAQTVAAEVEAKIVRNANTVLPANRSLAALFELYNQIACHFTTFPELDHYGPQSGRRYLGPVFGDFAANEVSWPTGAGPRTFAYLRPEDPNFLEIMNGLIEFECRCIVYAPGITPEQLFTYREAGLTISVEPVSLSQLIESVDLCVLHGVGETALRFLLAGTPLLLLPSHLEAFLLASRIELLGAGMIARGQVTARLIAAALRRLESQPRYRERAQAFSTKHSPTLLSASEFATKVID